MKLIKIILIILGIFLCNACAKNYQFNPPNSKIGKECVSSCAAQEASCQEQNDSQKAACQNWAKDDYDACVRMFPLNHANQCRQRNCEPISYFSCSENYRHCYQECGGKVSEIK